MLSCAGSRDRTVWHRQPWSRFQSLGLKYTNAVQFVFVADMRVSLVASPSSTSGLILIQTLERQL